MSDEFIDGHALATYISALHSEREAAKTLQKQQPRKRSSLSSDERKKVLEKTAGRCHICGGEVDDKWQADHVLAHSAGGVHSVDNYLAAHATCNSYRWDYLSEEFQLILKLGVWARTQIEGKTKIGLSAGELFAKKERTRLQRRRKSN